MTDTAVVPVSDELDAERKRKVALLKAIGLDRVAPEQRELALNIAKRYDLDLLLKHLVLIDGRPYVTRDGLLHIAHRSDQLDGIEVTEPVVKSVEGAGEFWYVEATVYRKDMSRPFKYGGRYPTKGGNQKFAPEMATKVAEVMALRRAFDVSLPTAEEGWDTEVPASEPEQPKTLAEKAAERAQAVRQAEPENEPPSQPSTPERPEVTASEPKPAAHSPIEFAQVHEDADLQAGMGLLGK